MLTSKTGCETQAKKKLEKLKTKFTVNKNLKKKLNPSNNQILKLLFIHAYYQVVAQFSNETLVKFEARNHILDSFF